jgi:hypothetical protein
MASGVCSAARCRCARSQPRVQRTTRSSHIACHLPYAQVCARPEGMDAVSEEHLAR